MTRAVTILTALLCVGAGAYCAAATRSGELQQTVPDKDFGKAFFKLGSIGDKVIMEPVIAAQFELTVLKGSKPPGSPSIVSCRVAERHLGTPDGTTDFSLIVLKCDDAELGIRSVLFTYDK